MTSANGIKLTDLNAAPTINSLDLLYAVRGIGGANQSSVSISLANAVKSFKNLDVLTTVNSVNLVPMVNDPSGTPAGKVASVEGLLKAWKNYDTLTSANSTDLIPVIQDPSGTPALKNIAKSDLLSGMGGSGVSEAIARSHAKGQVISNFYDICSDPANIMGLWFFDQHGDSTTITDRSIKGHNATLSANGSTLNPGYDGLCPYVDLTSDAYFELTDNNDFSFGDGSSDDAFSIIALISPNGSNFKRLLGKYSVESGATKKEWQFQNASNVLVLNCYDDSAGAIIGRSYGSDLSGDIGEWHVYAATYSGNGTHSGINIYRDGVDVDDSDSGSGSYTAMENLAGNVGNFMVNTGGSRANFGDYKAGVIAIIKEELSAVKIKQVSQALLAYANNLV